MQRLYFDCSGLHGSGLRVKDWELTSPTDIVLLIEGETTRSGKHSNRVNLLIIRRSIPEAFRGTASEYITKASEYLAKIKECFVKNDKVETSVLDLNKVYKGKGNIRGTL